jgi:hypothetical protein
MKRKKMANKYLKIHGVKPQENGRLSILLGNLGIGVCCFWGEKEYRITDIQQDGKVITLKSLDGIISVSTHLFVEVEIVRKEIKSGYLDRDDIQNFDKVCDENGNTYVCIRQDSDEGFTGTGGEYLIDENLNVWGFNSNISLYLIQKNNSKYMSIQHG